MIVKGDPTRICFVAGTLGQGGAERQLFYLLSALVRMEVPVSLISLTADEFWNNPMRTLGIPVIEIGKCRSRIAKAIAVLKASHRTGARIIQSQHFYTNIYAGLAARVLGVRSVAAVRNDLSSELRGSHPRVRMLGLRLATQIAANSQQSISRLSRKGFAAEKLFYLPNVIDAQQFSPDLKRRAAMQPFTILGVGRLGPEKRFDRFLDIVARVSHAANAPVSALIAGDGKQRSLIQEQANAVSSGNLKVRLVGAVADPLELYRSADVLLSTSDWEGTPNVIMEAMACGLPVVASNVGGVPELINDGIRGFTFEPNDLERATFCLNLLQNNPMQRGVIGLAGRDWIQRERSAEILPSILTTFIRRVLA